VVAVVAAVSLPLVAERLSARAAQSSVVLQWRMPAAQALLMARVLPWWWAQRSLVRQQEAPSSLEAAMPLLSALPPAEDWVSLTLPSLRAR
jgi:hypothetical protein